MELRRPFVAGAVGVLLLTAAPPRPAASQDGAPSPRRVVAVGDVHGAYPQLVSILRAAGLVDGDNHWTGGDAVLVQTGDFTDRGVDIRPVMDLLMALEEEAPRTGGRVVVLLGNHETMTMTRFFRDASPDVYARFADQRSDERRQDGWRAYARLMRDRRRELGRDPPGELTEAAWLTAHPPGFLEYVEAFGPEGRYGRWLRRKPAAAEIDGTVFLHGGLNPDRAEPSLEALNRRARDEIAFFDEMTAQLARRDLILPFFTFDETLDAALADLELWADRLRAPATAATVSAADRRHAQMLVELLGIDTWSIVDPDGPFWFRGFASWTPEVGTPIVDTLQERYEASRFVVGHTVSASHRILSRFDDRVFLIDTGMLSEAYQGQPSALEIAGDRVTAVYVDRRVPLVGAAVGTAP